jgi:glycosyltransferase involved in cell wall biosynthesis
MTPSPLRLLLAGPLPPPFGGMANQTRQLARLLEEEGVRVTVVRTNAPYRPAWVKNLRGIRAAFRLLPYLGKLWLESGRADVVHVMANSGWAWHLFAAPAIRIARLRGRPVVVNYRGGLAREFLARSATSVKRSFRRVSCAMCSATTARSPMSFLTSSTGRYFTRETTHPSRRP